MTKGNDEVTQICMYLKESRKKIDSPEGNSLVPVQLGRTGGSAVRKENANRPTWKMRIDILVRLPKT